MQLAGHGLCLCALIKPLNTPCPAENGLGCPRAQLGHTNTEQGTPTALRQMLVNTPSPQISCMQSIPSSKPAPCWHSCAQLLLAPVPVCTHRGTDAAKLSPSCRTPSSLTQLLHLPARDLLTFTNHSEVGVLSPGC